MAWPRSLHPSYKMLDGLRIDSRCLICVCCVVDKFVLGPISSLVFCRFNLMPRGCPSVSNWDMNHLTSLSGRKRFVSSMKELV
jgi:hypothetical protein